MGTRKNISSGTYWEDIIGYSRAVKIGNAVEVSGTVTVDEDNVVGIGNFYPQTKFIIQKIERVLKHVVMARRLRTRAGRVSKAKT